MNQIYAMTKVLFKANFKRNFDVSAEIMKYFEIDFNNKSFIYQKVEELNEGCMLLFKENEKINKCERVN